MKCPCIDCICIAVCRHKEFFDMLNDCHLIVMRLYYTDTDVPGTRSRSFSRTVKEIETYLEPTSWHIKKVDNDGFAHIWSREGILQ